MAKKKTATAGEGEGVYVSFVSNVPRHTREIGAKDFHRAGIDHGKISCAAGEVVKVSQEAADYLVDELGEFELVDPEDVEETDEEENKPATRLQDTVPGDGEDAGAGGSSQGANTRDGAGARSATINR